MTPKATPAKHTSGETPSPLEHGTSEGSRAWAVSTNKRAASSRLGWSCSPYAFLNFEPRPRLHSQNHTIKTSIKCLFSWVDQGFRSDILCLDEPMDSMIGKPVSPARWLACPISHFGELCGSDVNDDFQKSGISMNS